MNDPVASPEREAIATLVDLHVRPEDASRMMRELVVQRSEDELRQRLSRSPAPVASPEHLEAVTCRACATVEGIEATDEGACPRCGSDDWVYVELRRISHPIRPSATALAPAPCFSGREEAESPEQAPPVGAWLTLTDGHLWQIERARNDASVGGNTSHVLAHLWREMEAQRRRAEEAERERDSYKRLWDDLCQVTTDRNREIGEFWTRLTASESSRAAAVKELETVRRNHGAAIGREAALRKRLAAARKLAGEAIAEVVTTVGVGNRTDSLLTRLAALSSAAPEET